MMMAESLIPPEVVVVDELGPLLVVGQQEGVDVTHGDHWHADNKESLSKTSLSDSKSTFECISSLDHL